MCGGIKFLYCNKLMQCVFIFFDVIVLMMIVVMQMTTTMMMSVAKMKIQAEEELMQRKNQLLRAPQWHPDKGTIDHHHHHLHHRNQHITQAGTTCDLPSKADLIQYSGLKVCGLRFL